MISPEYQARVDLLIRILPAVTQEKIFALKGGTGINLFVRDMPRLSVDIDLTYLPINSRAEALNGIAEALNRIKAGLDKLLPGVSTRTIAQSDGQEAKLLCRWNGAAVTIEINTTIRGNLWPIRELPLAQSAREQLRMAVAMPVLSNEELYGGKICAALDRQHPRDLFDIQQLFDQEGLSDGIRLGFLASLLSHGRPMHELLRPQFQDKRELFDKQFTGMTVVPFSYEQFEAARERLVKTIHALMLDDDREFLLSFKRGEPDWSLFPLDALQNMPAVQWKLANVQRLKKNHSKHAAQLQALEDAFSD